MTPLVVGLLVGWAMLPPGRRARFVGPDIGPHLRRARRWSWAARLVPNRRDGVVGAVTSLPELLELTARSMRAGLSMRASLVRSAEAVPAAGLGPALARADTGASLSEALDGWSAGIEHPDADLTAAVLLLGDASGAAIASQLDQTAARLRQRAALADEIRALTAQTRASATVVALAPLAFAAVVATADDRLIASTFGTTVGRVSVGVGLVLEVLGVWWMRRLTEVDA